jgi:hypothetical protein
MPRASAASVTGTRRCFGVGSTPQRYVLNSSPIREHHQNRRRKPLEGVMNFGSGTVPSRYGYSKTMKTIPERRFRRGVGVRRPVPGAGARGCASARARPQRGFQRTEVGGSHRLLEWRYMPHDLPPWEALYQQRGSGGSKQASSRRWSTTCAYSCAFRRAGHPSRRPPYSTRAPCVLLRRAALGAATTGPSPRRAPRCTRRWTLWGICSPCM